MLLSCLKKRRLIDSHIFGVKFNRCANASIEKHPWEPLFFFYFIPCISWNLAIGVYVSRLRQGKPPAQTGRKLASVYRYPAVCCRRNRLCYCELVTEYGLERRHLLFFMDIGTREVRLGGIVKDPNGNWSTQIARNMCYMWDGFLLGKQYLIHDRDATFTKRFDSVF